MAELNELTKRLLAEGWKPEETPPGTKEYFWFYGGWTYTTEALRAMTFETPCGLLVEGSRFGNGDMSCQGICWQPENAEWGSSDTLYQNIGNRRTAPDSE